jgi:hypothetical protein
MMSVIALSAVMLSIMVLIVIMLCRYTDCH